MAEIVDNTTAGPIPENVDPRPIDVVADQKAKQNDQAIGGSQSPPRVEAPPNVDVAAPPLPTIPVSMPSVMDFAQEAARQAAQDAVKDAIKNMTINGQSPTFSGSSVSFDVPVAPTASEMFAQQNQPQPQPTSTLHSPNLGSAQGGTPENPSQLHAADSGSAQKDGPVTTSKLSDSEFENFLLMGQSESAKGYQAAEARREARKADMEDGFSPLSRERQRGEMRGEYEERMREMSRLKADKEVGEAINQGDASYFRNGFVPVLVTRKDGARKILIQVSNANSSVVEGATGQERTRQLPEESAYYIAGGNEIFHPWKIYSETVEGQTRVKIEYNSTIYRSFGNYEKYPVNGLDQFTGAMTGFVVLQAEVNGDNLTVDEQKILWGQSDNGTRITFSEEKQTGYTLPIAYLYQDNSGWKIRQLLFEDKTISSICVDGKPAIYPI